VTSYCLDIRLATGTEIYGPNTFVVNVNGTIIGLTRHPTRFVAQFRKLRRSNKFSEFVSIYVNHHHRAVHIASDGGRICRPMIIVENALPKVTSEHMKVSLLSFKPLHSGWAPFKNLNKRIPWTCFRLFSFLEFS